ncbi:MAG: pilus assembly protein [Sphingopyxis sp.]|nr:pilus assembly protein [Sphingopyxis sp.]
MNRRPHPAIARFLGEERATALIEFALTAPVFLLVLMGIFDFSMQMYAKSVLNGAVNRAARDAALEGNNLSQSALDTVVQDNVRAIFKDATLTFTRKAYDSYSHTNKPDVEIVIINGKTCEIYWARNGQGTGDEVVNYTATMKFNRMFPAWKMLGQPQETTLSATTVLRNQPFADNTDNTTPVCAP